MTREGQPSHLWEGLRSRQDCEPEHLRVRLQIPWNRGEEGRRRPRDTVEGRAREASPKWTEHTAARRVDVAHVVPSPRRARVRERDISLRPRAVPASPSLG
jgi:hypothetical protein